VKYKKKLIEVALPLEAINLASGKEKSIRQGHPSTLHLWWARRPLAAARAVIFAQMVDDPSAHPNIFKTEKEQDKERQRLFQIIEELVKWENTSNIGLLKKAQEEIWQSWRYSCAENADHKLAKELFDRHTLPAFHDPFSGGGALPLEAQRLGLNSFASDLNPVSVLLNKAMIEYPTQFRGMPPVNPISQNHKVQMDSKWEGAHGLSEDVNFYGGWVKAEAEKKLGKLYPKVRVTEDMVVKRPDLQKYKNQNLTVIAFLWARTVKSPNPAFSDIDVPLVTSFLLSSKDSKEVFVHPVIDGKKYSFEVRVGKPENLELTKSGTSAGKRAAFHCLLSGTPISYDYIRQEGKNNRMGVRLMAVIAEGDRGRVYVSPGKDIETIADQASPEWIPDAILPNNPRDFKTPNYGLINFSDLFTPRQLVSLTTFADLVSDAKSKVKSDAVSAGMNDASADAYSNAIAVFLTCANGKLADYNSTACSWISGGQTMRNTFGRQAIPMVWDFAEANVLSDSTGSYLSCIEQVRRVVAELPCGNFGSAVQADAQTQSISTNKVISTDPPYYDNIGYADLSDFFYIWMRRALR
jgi:putative DNA methylase